MPVQELRIPLSGLDVARGTYPVNVTWEGERLRARPPLTRDASVPGAAAAMATQRVMVAGPARRTLVRAKVAGANTLLALNPNAAWATTDTESINLAGEGDIGDRMLDVAVVGTPSLQAAYIAPGNGRLRQLDLTSGLLTLPAPTIDGAAVNENIEHVGVFAPAGIPRLMVSSRSGALGGIANDDSSVWFSNPADPLVFDSDNRVRLRPGDGDYIRRIVRWRDMTFVFKSDAFWVFTGEGELAPGVTTFYRRPVEGVGLTCDAAVCTAPDGVYFMGPGGLWRTTGGPPVYLGEPVRTLHYGSGLLDAAGAAKSVLVDAHNFAATAYDELLYADGRVYFSSNANNGGSGTNMLVYELARREFSVWTMGGRKFVSGDELCSLSNQGEVGVLDQSGTGTNDFVGSAITSAFIPRWFGPWMDFGTQVRKVVRNVRIVGSGRGSFALQTDYKVGGNVLQSFDCDDFDGPRLEGIIHRVAYRGRVFRPDVIFVDGSTDGAITRPAGIEAIWVNVDGALPVNEPQP